MNDPPLLHTVLKRYPFIQKSLERRKWRLCLSQLRGPTHATSDADYYKRINMPMEILQAVGHRVKTKHRVKLLIGWQHCNLNYELSNSELQLFGCYRYRSVGQLAAHHGCTGYFKYLHSKGGTPSLGELQKLANIAAIRDYGSTVAAIVTLANGSMMQLQHRYMNIERMINPMSNPLVLKPVWDALQGGSYSVQYFFCRALQNGDNTMALWLLSQFRSAFQATLESDPFALSCTDYDHPTRTLATHVTPLHTAALCCHANVVRALLDVGAPPMRCTPNGLLPLHFSASLGMLCVLVSALPRGEEVARYLCCNRGCAFSVLTCVIRHAATTTKPAAMVEYVLSFADNPSQWLCGYGIERWTGAPLHAAVVVRDWPLVQRIAAEYKWTGLKVTQQNPQHLFEVVVPFGKDNKVDTRIALFIISNADWLGLSEQLSPFCVKNLLLSWLSRGLHDAFFALINKFGHCLSPDDQFVVLCKFVQYPIAGQLVPLLKKFIDPSQLHTEGSVFQTLLHAAILAGNYAIAHQCIALGASLDTRDDRGRTPLQIAASELRPHSSDFIELLVVAELERDGIMRGVQKRRVVYHVKRLLMPMVQLSREQICSDEIEEEPLEYQS